VIGRNASLPDMDGYLTKPIPPRELDDVLENYLARRAQELVTIGSAKNRDPGRLIIKNESA
jgi:DNA-binding response OmpR family regulator